MPPYQHYSFSPLSHCLQILKVWITAQHKALLVHGGDALFLQYETHLWERAGLGTAELMEEAGSSSLSWSVVTSLESKDVSGSYKAGKQ